MIKKLTLIIVIGITSLTCWHFFQTNYIKQVEKNRGKLVEVFARATETDQNSRLKQLNIPYLIRSKSEGDPEYSTIQEEGKPTIRIKKNDRVKKLSNSEKINNIIQTFLYSRNPVKVETLDSIFHKELSTEIPGVKTAVVYIDNINKDTSYSREDTLIGLSVISTNRYYYGMRNEIILQASTELPVLYILFNESIALLTIISIWLILIIPSIFILVKDIKRKTTQLCSPVVNTYNGSSHCITINNGLILDTSLCQLVGNNKSVPLTKQSIQLLALLLNSPDYFLTYQEIINQLWGSIENKGQERLTQSIKRLRESLEEFPEIIIENLRGAGYQLKIDNKDNNSKNKD
ncbi:MAG TPA: winged helix-turn-helix domain-containing protein [Macellibacteroides fermentans]|uniref:winged helix-turn-helix domain-containing protein n=1 Tax=Macellibacteroides fermentans TaxID=879969 RepID=UPI002BAF9B5D|nr:winged helix-turn-helix domain-containing protein [Macellibacteroides fermentans]